MLGQDCELKFELLKIILANPENRIAEIDAEDVSKNWKFVNSLFLVLSIA